MLAHTDEILRSSERHAVGTTVTPWRAIGVCLVFSGALYGAVLGSWSTRWEQMLFSAIKVPILLTFTGVVCLPSFYVGNTVLGLRDDFVRACRGLLAAQATLAIALASLSPVTAFLYASKVSYAGATLTNGVMFLGALLASQVTLARHYRPLIARNPKHKVTLVAWMLLFQFVAIQLAWTLRPFIGSPGMVTEFLRPESFTNAYVDAVEAMLMEF